MLLLHESARPSGRLRIAVTERSDGDVHPTRVAPDVLAARQAALTGTRWAMAAQVHGVDVWYVDDVRAAADLAVADIVVADIGRTSSARSVALWAADCATGLIIAGDRMVGFHAGWRGLAAGAVGRAIQTARGAGAPIELIVTGPVIGPCCYEFSEHDLRTVAAGVGATSTSLTAETSDGRRSLDVPRALDAAVGSAGEVIDVVAPGCTGCDERWFSHRARVDTGRHALVGWVA